MTRTLDITVVSSNYWPDPIGIALYAADIAEYLASSDHRVHVVAAQPHYPAWRIAPEYRGRRLVEERHNGVDITRLWVYVPSKQSAARRALYEASFLGHGLLASVRPRRADIIFSLIPNVGNGVLGAWWASRAHAPHLMFVQDLSGNGAQESGLKGGARIAGAVMRVETRLASRATFVGVCSEGFRPTLERGGVAPERIVNFPNWTRIGAARRDRGSVRAEMGWSEDETIVLHAGNMGAKQGLELVADYAARARTHAPGLRFVLMGDGSQQPAVGERLRDQPNAEVIPPVAEEALPDVLAAANVLLLHERPTVKEMSIPSKLTAYFTTGRPVVAAVAADGITGRDIERSGGGIVVAAGDAAAVVDAISSIAADPERASRLSSAGRAYAMEHYSRASAMTRLDELIGRCLDEST
jgi:colanic acid biosynthesis glycosyl transferase WcaI